MSSAPDAHPRTVAGAAIERLMEMAAHLEFISSRMVGVQSGCADVARELRGIHHELAKGLHHDGHTAGE